MGKRSVKDRCSDSDPKPKRRKMPPPPPPGPRMERTMSSVSEISMSQIGPKVRETLLNMERVKIRDPFSTENAELFQDFLDNVGGTALQDMNLTEMALLLRGVTSLWKRQVGACIIDMNYLVSFVTNTVVKSTNNDTGVLVEDEGDNIALDNIGSKKQAEGESDVSESVEAEVTHVDETITVTNSSETIIENNDMPQTQSDAGIDKLTNLLDNPDLPNSSTPIAAIEDDMLASSGYGTDVVESSVGGSEKGELDKNDNVLSDNSQQKHLMNTRKKLLDYTTFFPPELMKLLGKICDRDITKKPRKETAPPVLISYLDIPITGDLSDNDEPPTLTSELDFIFERRTRKNAKKAMLENCLAGEGAVEAAELCEAPLFSEVGENVDETTNTSSMENDLADFCELPKEEFSPEDILAIQSGITQLHYLPFTCDLSNDELRRTFKSLLLGLTKIFKKYAPTNGHNAMTLAASKVCAEMSSTYPELFKSPQTQLQVAPGSIESNEMNASAACSASDEPNLTVMERSNEKTLNESQFKMREMIVDMQKSIVPKYARIPLIEENTVEFYRRVKVFEDRMKKVLERESRNEEFDVRKYEMDVLDAANKESQEVDVNDLDSQIPSPISISPFGTPEKLSAFDDNYLGIQLGGIPSPSTSSETSDSQKWVPLTQIFTHMKRMEKPEAARVFYAVLALLSFQNLDVKYDNHYSAESAAVTKKSLDHAQETKYQKGLKIMSSRCPDVDREEVFLSPLSSQSRTNTFRALQLRANSTDFRGLGISRMRSDSCNSYGLGEVVNGDLTHDIERTFVRSECNVYKGNVCGFKKQRVSNKKTPLVTKNKSKALGNLKLAET